MPFFFLAQNTLIQLDSSHSFGQLVLFLLTQRAQSFASKDGANNVRLNVAIMTNEEGEIVLSI